MPHRNARYKVRPRQVRRGLTWRRMPLSGILPMLGFPEHYHLPENVVPLRKLLIPPVWRAGFFIPRCAGFPAKDRHKTSRHAVSHGRTFLYNSLLRLNQLVPAHRLFQPACGVPPGGPACSPSTTPRGRTICVAERKKILKSSKKLRCFT